MIPSGDFWHENSPILINEQWKLATRSVAAAANQQHNMVNNCCGMQLSATPSRTLAPQGFSPNKPA
jgi:hypothetical protein